MIHPLYLDMLLSLFRYGLLCVIIILSFLFTPATFGDSCPSCVHNSPFLIDGINLQELDRQNLSTFRHIDPRDIGRSMDLSQYGSMNMTDLTQAIIETANSSDKSDNQEAAVMALQTEIVLAMQEANKNLPRYSIPEGLNLSPSSFSLLKRLAYVPKEWDQTGGSAEHCGNCWVWADTGALQLDLANQKNITERLSVQYFTSAYHNGTGIWACCGGNPSWFADFYNSSKTIIPWTNVNASFADSTSMCEQGESTTVPVSSISKEPSYQINQMHAEMISTNARYEEMEISNTSAVSSIKSALQSGKGVIIIYTPDTWDPFMDFWTNETESTIFTPCPTPGVTGNDGGHVMLIVGYDDKDPEHRYWLVLNSWGAPQNRPDGLFRLSMDLDYSRQNTDGVNAYEFYVLDVDWK